MRGIILVAAFGALVEAVPVADAQAYRAAVDPRIELLSIVFRLAGNFEYNQGRIARYVEAVERQFAPYRNHDAIRIARQLADSDEVSLDAVMSMAVNVTAAPALAERVPFDAPASRLESRWHGAKARAFLAALRRFAVDARFGEFLASQRSLYDTTGARLRAVLAASFDLPWFDAFFGGHPDARFSVVPGLLNGGSSYGAGLVAEDGVEEIYSIPGVVAVDSAGWPLFTDGSLRTTVHEFAHSYVNPLIDGAVPRLEDDGRRLLQPLREEFAAQAYDDGIIVIKESPVRAATVRYVIVHRGAEAGRRAVQTEEGRSFLWTGELVELLGEYERERPRYPTLSAFLPRLVAFFDGAAADVGETIRRYDRRRPHVVSCNVSDGARDVDPALRELVIRFDRPMDRGNFALGGMGEVPVPAFGVGHFDETGTVFTAPMTLEADREYEFHLNWPGGGAIASGEGVLLKHVRVRFRTRP